MGRDGCDLTRRPRTVWRSSSGWSRSTARSASLFFQAEDGIRDDLVTGVQTCALPISGCQPVGAGGPDRLATCPTGGRGDRKSVVEGKSVDLGGRRIIKKKKNTTGGSGRRSDGQ